MTGIRLAVFDCDGTLVDSERTIIEAMTAAYDVIGLPVPSDQSIRGVVGLSLPDAVRRLLAPKAHDRAAALEKAYREAFFDLRRNGMIHEPLYPGARESLNALKEKGLLLGIATGKGRQGLLKTLEGHGLLPLFDTLQTADHHPGKPHPSMLLAAMMEAGARAPETLFIGDTTFDMEMGRNAKVTPLGAAWGYHPPELLLRHGARFVLEAFDEVLAHALPLSSGK
ncbi:MAG TPA: HAD-IA family hydrolase [Sphingomonadales bacterium]|nr:HAD-IA family hydrolase [Sphingomonadales bacterium]